jgi:hypothetical protein
MVSLKVNFDISNYTWELYIFFTFNICEHNIDSYAAYLKATSEHFYKQSILMKTERIILV